MCCVITGIYNEQTRGGHESLSVVLSYVLLGRAGKSNKIVVHTTENDKNARMVTADEPRFVCVLDR